MKRCVSCGVEKSLDDFYRDNRYLDSPPRAACKQCINQRQRRSRRQVQPQPKACSKCGEKKPPHEFVRDAKRTDGLRSECKACFYSPERHVKNTRWRQTHSDHVRRYNAEWQTYRLRWQKRWRKEYPEKAAALDAVLRHRRRARKSAVENTLTARQWRDIKAIYENRCVYCGKKAARLTMDHVIPLVHDGSHTAANVVPACKPCNLKKHDKPAPTHQPNFLGHTLPPDQPRKESS